MEPISPLAPAPAYRPAVLRWLTLCLVLIALMVAVGGVTRLTESGLSIVKWELVAGTLPPMNDTAWQTEFDAYKQTPQFQKVNPNFGIHDFQRIFWLEYVHRLLGRVIGLVLFLPLFYFMARRRLPGALLKRMGFAALLVAAQGAVGWIMVASGLHDAPRVEPLKLALHLLLAFSLFSLLLWTRCEIRGSTRHEGYKSLARAARVVLALVVLQLVFGALVAGLRAGYYYNTYPLMDGAFIPPGLEALSPWWRNHLESVLTVQFQHRMGALVVVASVTGLVSYGWRQVALRPLLTRLILVVALQFCLGVATLLSTVDLWLASAHQLGALLLVSVLVRLVYATPLGARAKAGA